MQYAHLTWTDDGAPTSAVHNDVYFSTSGGRAETELVFLEGNGLPARWQNRECFTIAETGFGTGLNFLHSWDRFLATADAGARLHFISTENAPLSPEDLVKAHAAWGELGDNAAQLRAQYPLPIAGWHRMHFGRVTLTLGLGDATELLRSMDASIDAWFLDGFAPAKNPDMWHAGLIEQIASLSTGGTTLASFTAAGEVRRALEAQGFAIERRDGFAHKRHRIAGVMQSKASPAIAKRNAKHCIVIGAGIAGASTAYALAQRGHRVTVLEAQSEAACGASGNEAAVLYPLLTRIPGAQTQWYMGAYAHMLRLLPQLDGAIYAQPGMLKTPKDAKEETRLHAAAMAMHPAIVRYVEREEASALCGVDLASGGAWFAQGTWLNPPSIVRAMLAHPNIEVQYNARVTELPEADAVILATGHATSHFAPELAIAASAGQLSRIPVTQTKEKLRAILCHKGYIIPQGDHYVAGATYDHGDLSGEVTRENHAKNAAEIAAALPDWLRNNDMHTWTGRTSLRATTPDRMPYVGAIREGLYVTAGHGSRGMLSAPLAGECIASMIEHEMLPIAREVAVSVNPLRTLRPSRDWPKAEMQAASA